MQMGMVPIGSRVRQIKFISETLARSDRLLREVWHAVHGVGHAPPCQWMVVGAGSSFFKMTRTMSPTSTWISGAGTVPLYVYASTILPGSTSQSASCAVTTNWIATFFVFMGAFTYGVVYTVWLKRRTWLNIVVGGLAGSFAVLAGSAAAGATFSPVAFIIAGVLFLWTPPHFWALAIHRREEYASVDIPMLPVTHGVAFTKLHILLYTIIMFLITLLPYATRMSGPLYLLGAVVLGGGFLYWAVELMRGKNKNAPMETFKYSIIYLMALFVVGRAQQKDFHLKVLAALADVLKDNDVYRLSN